MSRDECLTSEIKDLLDEHALVSNTGVVARAIVTLLNIRNLLAKPTTAYSTHDRIFLTEDVS